MNNELNELIDAWKLCNSGTKQQNQQQAFNYIENFKQNSQNLLECGFSILNNNTIQPELIHFGTQLITHAIKFKWNSLDIEKKLLIKNCLHSLISNLNDNSTILKLSYLKTSVCLTYLELIKREWPQNWPSLLDELYLISTKSFQHLNLILNLFKLMADEFVLNNINLPAPRRKDINQCLNANMQQIFDFFLNSLESSYKMYMQLKEENAQGLNENHIVISLLQACLECLAYYVDWIQIQIVLSRNALLVELVLNLLNDQFVCIHSAKCLVVLVSRKGQANDRKPLLGLFSSTALNKIFECIKLSFVSFRQNRNYKELLKYLLQILIEMGMQLCYLWSDSKFVKPNEINIYLCAIYEFTINESKVLSFEALQLWNSFLSNSFIKNDSTIGECIQKLATNLTNTFMLFKVTSCRQLTSIYDEFDSDEDLLKFFYKYRAELAKLIRQGSQLYLNSFVNAALAWAVKIINETSNDVNALAQGYNTSSYLFLAWDALIFFWPNIMITINKQIKSNHVTPELLLLKDNLLQMLNYSINFKTANANFTSYNLSLLSSLMVIGEMSADNIDLMLKVTLEKLFEGFNHFKQVTEANVDEHFKAQSTPETPTSAIYGSKSLKIKCILNVRRHFAAMILNICRNYTKKVKQFFEFIYLNVNNLLNETTGNAVFAYEKEGQTAIASNKVLTQMEQIIFIESLIYCSNEFNSFDMQTQFLNQNLNSIKEFFFFNTEFLKSIENINYFALFTGLTSQVTGEQNILIQKEASLINRKQIFYSVNALFGVLKCVQVPVITDALTVERKNELIASGYFDISTNSIRNPAFSFYIQLFEHLIKLLKCFNMLHLDGFKETFLNEYKGCLQMTDAMKTLSLGMAQQAGSYDAKHIDVSEISQTSATYESDKLLMFIYNTYDTLNQLISLYFSNFKHEFLLVPVNDANTEFAFKFGEAVFTCFNELPDYRMRTIIRYVLKCLLESGVMCSNEQVKSELFVVRLNQMVFEYFLPSILVRINEKNKYFKQLNDALQQQQQDIENDNGINQSPELTEKQIEGQIIEENQFTLMCRDLVDLVKTFFNFSTSAAGIGQQAKAESNNENICDDAEQIDENLERDENIDTMKAPSASSTSPISELAVYLLNNSQIIYQGILLILFEGLCWNDSFCCARLARLAQNLIEMFPIKTQKDEIKPQQFTLYLSEQISSHFFESCLNALQIHGEHNDISNSLLILSFLIYDKFPLSCHDLFNKLLAKIPNLNKKALDELIYKYKQNFTSNMEKHKKEKKELFRKILNPIIGKNVGQLYKNEVIIRNLPPLISQVPRNRKRFLQRQYNKEYFEACENGTEALSICNLFDN